VSQDAITLGFRTQVDVFEEAFHMQTSLPLPPNAFDGVFGVSLPGPGVQHPFKTMIESGNLDRNLFSLKLPPSVSEAGELLFGAWDDDLYTGELITLPLTWPWENLRHLPGWSVPFTGIRMGSKMAGVNYHIAVFETDFPYIAIPRGILIELNKYLGIDASGMVDCKHRSKLPNLMVALRYGEFPLTQMEYIIDIGEGRCMSAFVEKQGDDKLVVLGSAFLRGFYTIFDADDRTVSCECRLYFAFWGGFL
jgi:hypothetical protein